MKDPSKELGCRVCGMQAEFILAECGKVKVILKMVDEKASKGKPEKVFKTVDSTFDIPRSQYKYVLQAELIKWLKWVKFEESCRAWLTDQVLDFAMPKP